MNYQSVNVVYGRTWLNTILLALAADPGAALIVAPKIRLSQDPAFNPTPDSTRAALATNEATFSGYTAGGYAGTVSAPLALGLSVIGARMTALAVADADDPFVSNNIYGYWVDDGTDVIVAEAFDGGAIASIGMTGDFVALAVLLPLALRQATS